VRKLSFGDSSDGNWALHLLLMPKTLRKKLNEKKASHPVGLISIHHAKGYLEV